MALEGDISRIRSLQDFQKNMLIRFHVSMLTTLTIKCIINIQDFKIIALASWLHDDLLF